MLQVKKEDVVNADPVAWTNMTIQLPSEYWRDFVEQRSFERRKREEERTIPLETGESRRPGLKPVWIFIQGKFERIVWIVDKESSRN
jgi:hypothetical protein